MATNKLERTYTIPLRAGFVKVPKYYRAKRAINQIKGYIVKHMKSDDVKLGNVLNEHIWERGITNPPGKVTVRAIKVDGVVTVELEGYEYKVEKVQVEKTDKPTSFKDKLAAKLKQSKDGVSDSEVVEADVKADVEAESKSKEDVKAESKSKADVKADVVDESVKDSDSKPVKSDK